MKAPKIQQTTDYSIFRRFNSNRQVNKFHLRKLINSITSKNLLYLFPIVVNARMEIVDGQHRLAAARDLKVPVYYITDDDVTQADIAMVNNNRKGWTGMDYVHFYKEQGYPAYKRLLTLLTRYPVNVIGCSRLMRKGDGVGYGGGNDTHKLRSGTITDDDYDMALATLEVANALYNYINYAFRIDVLFDIKRTMVKNQLPKARCIERMAAGGKVFPKYCEKDDPEITNLVRKILVDHKEHSAEDVRRILKEK